MKRATISDAPKVLNINDRAMWVLGYNAALEAIETEAKPWPFTGCSGPLTDCDMEDRDSVQASGLTPSEVHQLWQEALDGGGPEATAPMRFARLIERAAGVPGLHGSKQ